MRNTRSYRVERRFPAPRLTGPMSWLSTGLLASILMIGAFVRDVRANDHVVDGNYCTATAEVAQSACESEVEDDYWIAVGNCTNVSNTGARGKCYSDAEDEQKEAAELCVDQFAARGELCAAIGEDRYDPIFKASKFVDPLEIGNGVEPNPYYPLVPGTQWTYEGGDETIVVTVTDETKLIGGVTCLTVNDIVVEDGQPLEDTDDWYAQDKDGNVWYCGEISLNYEIPDGEDEAELVHIEGSWKAFRDLAKPGIVMFANPQVGVVYRQEMALGNAEDVAEILSVTANEAAPEAGIACNNDCVMTKDYSPVEPGVFEHKFYAPGVGFIVEVKPETGERLKLVSMTP